MNRIIELIQYAKTVKDDFIIDRMAFTREEQEEAVKLNPYDVLRYVSNLDKDLMHEASRLLGREDIIDEFDRMLMQPTMVNEFIKGGSSIESWIKFKQMTFTKEEQLEAVRYAPTIIQYINNPDKEVQLEVVKQDVWNIKLINNPHQEVIDYVLSMDNNTTM